MVLVVVATATVGACTEVTTDCFAVMMVAATEIGCETTVGLVGGSCRCMLCWCCKGATVAVLSLDEELTCGLLDSRSFSSMEIICCSSSFCCGVRLFREVRWMI